MRTRLVPAVAILGVAALLSGCSDGQFVFFPNMKPGENTVEKPLRQASGDGAGMTAFSTRPGDELADDDRADASGIR